MGTESAAVNFSEPVDKNKQYDCWASRLPSRAPTAAPVFSPSRIAAEAISNWSAGVRSASSAVAAGRYS